MPDLGYCGEQVRRHDHDRFLCSLFAPTHARDALQVLYALNIELARIPDVVSEPMLGRIRQQFWRESIDKIFAGGTPREPVGAELAGVVAGFGLARHDFDRLLDARSRDLDDNPPETLDALVTYADGTAGALAGLSADVLGVTDPESRGAARSAAIGFALTGLIRAIPFHARRRRLWLPGDLSRTLGLDAEALFRGEAGPAAREVIAAVAAEAGGRLASARSQRPQIDRRTLPALLPATLAALGLGRLRRAGFDPFDRRVVEIGPLVRLTRLTAAAAVNRY